MSLASVHLLDRAETFGPFLSFWVDGRPQTAGSKKPVPIREGKGEDARTVGHRVVESGSKESRAAKQAWRSDVRDAAERELASLPHGEWDKAAAMGVTFLFVRRRPQSQMRTGRNAGQVKEWALGLRPTQAPDALKLARLAEDALSGVVYADDAQIVDERLLKAYGDQCGLGPLDEGMLCEVRLVAGAHRASQDGQIAMGDVADTQSA